MTGDEWLAEFAAAVGVDQPSEEFVEAMLNIAGVAAHASERTAAPLTCWLIGVAGIDATRAAAIAARIAEGQ